MRCCLSRKVEARFKYESYGREGVFEVIRGISSVGKLALVDSYYRA